MAKTITRDGLVTCKIDFEFAIFANGHPNREIRENLNPLKHMPYTVILLYLIAHDLYYCTQIEGLLYLTIEECPKHNTQRWHFYYVLTVVCTKSINFFIKTPNF